MPALTPLLPPARPRGANTPGSRACPRDVPTASPDVTGMVAPGAPQPCSRGRSRHAAMHEQPGLLLNGLVAACSRLNRDAPAWCQAVK